MSKHQYQKKQKKQSQREPLSFFDRANKFLGKYDLTYFGVLFCVTLLVGFLLYDPRVSPGGDDSGYILAARNFLRQHKFPSFQAPLYPIVLSVIDLIFGMSITVFKVFSMCCMMAFVTLTFFAYRRRIPPLLLFITLLLTSINSHVLYFASQTYSEAFYMLMQSLLPLIFFKYFIDEDASGPSHGESPLASRIRRNLLLGIVLTGIVMARNIGYAALPAVVAWFLCYRKQLNAGRAVVYFAVCMAGAQLLKMMIWKNTGLHGSEQLSAFLYKDLYRPEYGQETVAGFFSRFWVNSNQYLSRFFVSMLGFRDSITAEGVFAPVKPVITILVYLLGLAGVIFSYRNNKALFFTGLFAGISVVVTFFILHSFWNQERLIVTAFPLLIMVLSGTLYYFFNMKRFRPYQILTIVPVALVFFFTLSDTSRAVKKARKLTGVYSGLTPDWRNYLMASAWVGKNLPETALVACRQPAISSVYAKGKQFYRIGKVNSSSFRSFIDKWSSGENYMAVEGNSMPDNVYVRLLPHYVARIAIDNNYYLIVNRSERLSEELAKWPDTRSITSAEEFKTLIGDVENQLSIYYADSLLLPLRQAKVTHILTASLRLNPNIKDGQIINTVERTALFIQEKYPNIFTLVKPFGNENDEPAKILRINWEVVKYPDGLP
ncbi:MAG: hypothetical protein LBL24_06500 [Bacteroidales bacterium]|jgi:hypothetical protein|nr:hypothetical protein [Bacteroidales bacterium]